MNKHTAQLPDGKVATRNSKTRVYSHAIAYGPARAASLIKINDGRIAYQQAERERYEADAVALETAQLICTNGYWDAPSVTKYHIAWSHDNIETVDEARAHGVAQYRKWSEQCAAAIARMEAENEKLAAGPELVGDWEAVAWCGRADLAAKQAASYAGNPQGSEVRIIEVEVAA